MPDTPDDFLDREGFADSTALQPKYIHAGEDYNEQPHLYMDEDEVSLVGDRKHLISVDPDFGTLLAGAMSFSANPHQISVAGGLYCFNPLLLSTVPSTTPTPIPVLIKATPPLLAGLGSLSDMLSGLQSSLGV